MIYASLFDTAFAHATSYSHGDLKIYSKHIQLDRQKLHKTILYTDAFIPTDISYQHQGHINIAWITEPRSLIPHFYRTDWINWNKFDCVLSSDLNFVNELNGSRRGRALWHAVGGCWIYEEDRGIHLKTKNLSIIASGKTQTFGHQLRHIIVNKFKNSFDGIFGTGYNTIPNKIEALKDYRFSLTVENDGGEDVFTEKLIDCLVTGTIPIYWGTKNISKYFNIDGMILIKNEQDFETILPLLTESYYSSKLEAIKENFQTAQKYLNTEDWFALNYPFLFQ